MNTSVTGGGQSDRKEREGSFVTWLNTQGLVCFTSWRLELYLCTTVSNIITTIDHTPHITDIFWRYVGREVIGHLSSLSVRTGDIERDVHQTINDDVELRDTPSLFQME